MEEKYPRKLTEEEQKYIDEAKEIYNKYKICHEHITFFVNGKYLDCIICGEKIE